MKLLSPRLWRIAWQVRFGLLVVPCVLAVLAWYQFRIANEAVERYRGIVTSTDHLLISTAQMRQSAQDMENAVRGLHSWMKDNSFKADDAERAATEKTYVAPYNEAKTHFEEQYREAGAQVPPNSEIENRLTDFYDHGQTWQREVASPLIMALRAPQPLDTQLAWRPFDEAEPDSNALRDALMQYRRAGLSGADEYHSISTTVLLCLEGVAVILALWIGMALSRAVTRPLGAMVEQSQRIEGGDYSQMPVGAPNEFGQLTRAMNAMATAIGARLERERLTGTLTGAVTRSLDPATVLETTAQELGEALRVSRCVLCLDGGEAALWYQWQAPGIAPLNDSPCRVSEYPRRVLQSGQTLAVADIAKDATLHTELRAQGVRALLATPLLLRGASAGVITLHQCGAVHAWSADEIALLEHAAAQVAIALDNARLFRESQQRAEELRVARDALALSSARLQEKNKELEEFVYTVSHDLKAPLISIQGYLEALQDEFGDKIPEDAKFYVQRVEANAAQLESLIGELIELSRIGRVRENWEETGTYQIAREAASELTLQAQRQAVQIEISPDLPAVFCEKKRLRQVFTNLLDNAIKYSDPTKPSRYVKVHSEDRGNAWRFAVEDNGLGIPPKDLDKAFGIFQRVGQNSAGTTMGLDSVPNSVPGSGIGLAIVRRTAEAHGGQAWAHSDGPGQGATFYFTLQKDNDSGVLPLS